MMKQIEQTVNSCEVAEMLGKEHKLLMRDLRRYMAQFNECKIAPVDFFWESTYKDKKGEIRPSYQITKKGCEFIAHKLTGTKGTAFTARYINRFHEMEDILAGKTEAEHPWFIKRFQGNDIVLWRDFKELTGIDIEKRKPDGWFEVMWKNRLFNAYGWRCDKKEFKRKYGFDFGEEDCMGYFYLRGIPAVLSLIHADRKMSISSEAEAEVLAGIAKVEEKKALPEKSEVVQQSQKAVQQLQIAGQQDAPGRISIMVNGVELSIESNGSVPQITVKQ